MVREAFMISLILGTPRVISDNESRITLGSSFGAQYVFFKVHSSIQDYNNAVNFEWIINYETDTHGCNSCKMEGLECHLSARFTYRLCTNCTNSSTCRK